MATNVAGDQARLFPWQMVHYIVHGGFNDPVKAGAAPPLGTDGGYLSAQIIPSGTTTPATNFVTLPPVPGSQTPPAIPIPRSQQIFGGTGAPLAAAATSVTTNLGGVYLGTIPQGAWIESVEMFIYLPFSGSSGLVNLVGVFYAQADATSTNGPGYQPSTLQPIAFLTGGGATNTTYSTETGLNRTAWSNAPAAGSPIVGPGIASTSFTTGVLASTSDIDLYFVSFVTGTNSTSLAAGSASVRIKFTGLEG